LIRESELKTLPFQAPRESRKDLLFRVPRTRKKGGTNNCFRRSSRRGSRRGRSRQGEGWHWGGEICQRSSPPHRTVIGTRLKKRSCRQRKDWGPNSENLKNGNLVRGRLPWISLRARGGDWESARVQDCMGGGCEYLHHDKDAKRHRASSKAATTHGEEWRLLFDRTAQSYGV